MQIVIGAVSLQFFPGKNLNIPIQTKILIVISHLIITM